jgi:hypothetical protein
MPEPGVQQVQHGVLDTADVQVNAAIALLRGVRRDHPVSLDFGVDERLIVGRVEVTQEIPA